MFGKSPDDGHDDRQDGPAMSVPHVPPKRRFVLHRVNPYDWNGELKDGMPVYNKIESITIDAHEVEINAAGNILRFREYLIHPVEGPTTRVVWCFNGWLDYEEVIIERPRILAPGSMIPFGESIN